MVWASGLFVVSGCDAEERRLRDPHQRGSMCLREVIDGMAEGMVSWSCHRVGGVGRSVGGGPGQRMAIVSKDAVGDDGIHVRDRRQPGWFWIRNEHLELCGQSAGVNGIAVYCGLARHANNNTQRCTVSMARIMAITGLSRPVVIGAVRALEESGLIHVSRMIGKCHVYTLLDLPVKQVDRSHEQPVKQVDRTCKAGLHELDSNKTVTSDETSEGSGEIPRYVCQVCGQPCKSRGGLTRHLNAKHDQDRVHPAIRTYRDVTGMNPRPGVRKLIIETVGSEAGDCSLWANVVTRWCAQGWRGGNVDGMLDYFGRGEVPGNGRGSVGQSGRQNRGNGDGKAKVSGSGEGDWARPNHGDWGVYIQGGSSVQGADIP